MTFRAPVPDAAPPLPWETEERKPKAVYAWTNAQGRPLFYTLRYEWTEKSGERRKVVTPRSCWERPDGSLTWEKKGPPDGWPRPLFNLRELAERPDAPVLAVEGEKACQAAQAGFPGYVATTWHGGCAAVGKADMAPLKGRDVTYWPDADQAGAKAARDFARAALAAGAARVRVVALPPGLPDGWDLADEAPEGLTPDVLAGLLSEAPEWAPAGLEAETEDAAREVGKARPSKQGGQPFDIGQYLDSISSGLEPEDLTECLAPVWDAIAAEGDPIVAERWKYRIADRFKLGKQAIRDSIKAARLVRGREAAERTREHWEAKRQGEVSEIHDRFGLNLGGTRYMLSSAGVGIYRSESPDAECEIIAPRPIWPRAVARDVITGEIRVEIAWIDPLGNERRKWCHGGIANDPAELRRLDGAPISHGRITSLCDWLLDAQSFIPSERRGLLVATRTGWVDLEQGSRFVLPGDPEITFIGDSNPPQGSIAEWAAGVTLLAEMGPSGYYGLAAVGLAAAAPLARLVGGRNPVMGIVAKSSQGKGSVLSYAMSVWHKPEGCLQIFGADSSPKGIQDGAYKASDQPIWVDEAHRLWERDRSKAEAVLYFLGNGQRRITSSKAQEAVGGEHWRGVGFFAAEHSFTEALQEGATFRAIELTGAPLATREQAETLQRIARENYGVMAPAIAAKLPELVAEIKEAVAEGATRARLRQPSLKGEEANTIALVPIGLELAADIAGVSLPSRDVGDWLADQAAKARRAHLDKASTALIEVVDMVRCGAWTGDRLIVGGDTVAWRGGNALGTAYLDINPLARPVRDLLNRHGGDIHARAWADRGLIQRGDGAHLKVKRRPQPGEFAPRVYRVNLDAIDRDEEPEPRAEDSRATGKVVSLDARRA